jgi:hypothetical protein
MRDGEGSRGGVGRAGQRTVTDRATSARRAAAAMVKRRGQRPRAAGIDGGACSMPSAAATSASLFHPTGGVAMARPKAAAPRVLSHPEACPWLGPSEPERERREGERGEEEQRKRMPVEQSRRIFIEDSRQCFDVCSPENLARGKWAGPRPA